jgi:5,10-methylene-tetrahydrofolate dehydrogenase/methenyl tetrahydrofolate cyclohydrolase
MVSKYIVEKIKTQLKEKISKLDGSPKLCIVSVGKDDASQVYIKNKIKLCRELGIDYIHINCHQDIHQSNLIGEIKRLNERQDIHGIIVQQPLPPHLNTEVIVNNLYINDMTIDKVYVIDNSIFNVVMTKKVMDELKRDTNIYKFETTGIFNIVSLKI